MGKDIGLGRVQELMQMPASELVNLLEGYIIRYTKYSWNEDWNFDLVDEWYFKGYSK
jgi:hypothetical protein